jgi:sulfide:quinone oxidoreductase
MTIVDPASEHFYQPLWTLAGAGVVDKEKTKKPMSSLIPSGVQWLKEKVLKVVPQENKVMLSHEIEIKYEFLIVATGLRIRWNPLRV